MLCFKTLFSVHLDIKVTHLWAVRPPQTFIRSSSVSLSRTNRNCQVFLQQPDWTEESGEQQLTRRFWSDPVCGRPPPNYCCGRSQKTSARAAPDQTAESPTNRTMKKRLVTADICRSSTLNTGRWSRWSVESCVSRRINYLYKKSIKFLFRSCCFLWLFIGDHLVFVVLRRLLQLNAILCHTEREDVTTFHHFNPKQAHTRGCDNNVQNRGTNPTRWRLTETQPPPVGR